jgi:anaphase-promoting complex subunit 2
LAVSMDMNDTDCKLSPLHEILRLSGMIFNLIRDYPSSLGDLERLKDLLARTRQYEHVIEVMKSQIDSRLLIPGAHTEDILQMYLRTYKVVSFLFKDVPPSLKRYRRLDVFMRVSKSVIDHLHKRSDSVKCIVAALLDESLMDVDPADTVQEENTNLNASVSMIASPGDIVGLDWTPPPLEGGGKPQDTMSLLIGVYGGKDYFLNEYREMLASRLVSAGSFDIDREVASLDLMKLKFDPDSLSDCSVMINDVQESKKLFLMIKTAIWTRRRRNILSSFILSKYFWPIIKDDDSTDYPTTADQFSFFPPELLALMRDYEEAFTEIKPTQRLQWRKDEGVVTISVEIRDKTIDFRVTPVHVQVLSCFVDALAVSSSAAGTPATTAVVPPSQMIPVLSMEDLVARTKLTMDKVKPVVQFWVSRGILRESQINRYIINE